MLAAQLTTPAQFHPGFPDGTRSREQLCRAILAVRPDLAREAQTFRAALVLLASVQVRHNVDLLARFCAVPREFVARCARRLCDNGVWERGMVRCSWIDVEGSGEEFWADVAVAEGRLCRRSDVGGALQWAPPGFWYKTFDVVEGESSGPAVYYSVPWADDSMLGGEGAAESPPQPEWLQVDPAPSSGCAEASGSDSWTDFEPGCRGIDLPPYIGCTLASGAQEVVWLR